MASTTNPSANSIPDPPGPRLKINGEVHSFTMNRHGDWLFQPSMAFDALYKKEGVDGQLSDSDTHSLTRNLYTFLQVMSRKGWAKPKPKDTDTSGGDNSAEFLPFTPNERTMIERYQEWDKRTLPANSAVSSTSTKEQARYQSASPPLSLSKDDIEEMRALQAWAEDKLVEKKVLIRCKSPVGEDEVGDDVNEPEGHLLDTKEHGWDLVGYDE